MPILFEFWDGLFPRRYSFQGFTPDTFSKPTQIRCDHRCVSKRWLVKPAATGRLALNVKTIIPEFFAACKNKMAEMAAKLSGNCLETRVTAVSAFDYEELRMVPATGLEPVRCYSLEPESSASANSATRA